MMEDPGASFPVPPWAIRLTLTEPELEAAAPPEDWETDFDEMPEL